MFERMMPILKSVGAGAATQVYVATHPSLAEVSGEYFSDCPVAELLVPLTQAEIDALWKKTEEIVAAW